MIKYLGLRELLSTFSLVEVPVFQYSYGPSSLQQCEFDLVACMMNRIGAEKMLELGVNEGHVSVGVLTHVPTITELVATDVPLGVPVWELPHRSRQDLPPGHLASGDKRFIVILSLGGDNAIGPILRDDHFDACLIDSEHTYEQCLADTKIATRVVRVGGVLFWHDMAHPMFPKLPQVLKDLPSTAYVVGNIAFGFVDQALKDWSTV